jgi:ParB family chromosome partitioning protein
LDNVAGFSGAVKIRMIPLDELALWEGNVRKDMDAAADAELEANIAEFNVLTSLVVRAGKKGFDVIAGGRRVRIAKKMQADGHPKAPKEMPCRVVECTDEQARTISLAENVVRQQLSPADEFEAYQKLAKDGKTPEQIAHIFGVGVSQVNKRLKLANLAPKIIKDFRAGKLTLNQLQALAISDDRKQQEAIADSGYTLDADEIREKLTEGEVPASDKRVKFVGFDTLEKEGVPVNRDLYEQDKSTVKDTKALNAAVEKKLKEIVAMLLAEGWGFAEQVKSGVNDYSIDRKYSDLAHKKVPLSKSDQTLLDDYKKELKAIKAKKWDDITSADDEREEQLDKLIEGLEEKQKLWADDVKKKGGAIFSLSAGGLEIRRGVRYKPEPKEVKTAAAAPKPKEKSEAEKRNLTDDVVHELTAHRTRAIGACIALQHEKGFKVAAAILIINAFDLAGWNESTLTQDLSHTDLPHDMDDAKGACPGHDTLERIRDELRRKLPKNREGVLKWCLDAKPAELYPFLAFIAGDLYDDMNVTGAENKETSVLIDAFKVDFADFYIPTEKNLFGKLGQEQLQRLIPRIRMGVLTPAELKLGKDALAQLAEREAKAAAKTGEAWLPYPLAAHPVKKKAETTAKPKATSSKKAAAKKKGKK